MIERNRVMLLCIADRATRACIWNAKVPTISVFKYVSLQFTERDWSRVYVAVCKRFFPF